MRPFVLPLLLSACGGPPDPAPAESSLVLKWEVDDTRFAGEPLERAELFTLAAADMDADGDPDLLFQRHHLARSELYENVDGQFVLLNPRDADLSGVFDNPGVPDLFAPLATMQADVVANGTPGLYVWHDENRGGLWRLQLLGSDATLRLRVNLPISELNGLDDATGLDAFSVEATVADGTAFSIGNDLVASQLVVEVLDGPLPMFVGRTMAPHTDARLELWKNDPHGVAWVDQLGGPERELFVTRGGLTGKLVAPQDPKQDQLFEWSDSGMAYVETAGLVPKDYCRGRQVTWIDVDADGVDELFLACTATANRLLDRDEQGVFTDVAESWGADGVEPEAFTWVDVDLDGRLDLVQNQTETLEVLLHRGDHFEAHPGSDFGLISPVPPANQQVAVFNPFTLQSFDFDRDGDLDVWASHFGDELSVAVLVNEDGVFVDRTKALGLDTATGFTSLVPVDVDLDGWVDFFSIDITGVTLYRNQRGEGFSAVEVPTALVDAVAADVDSDGRMDLVGQGPEAQHRVLFNRHEGGGDRVVVDVSAPLGSLVRGRYLDGSVQLLVHGGNTSRYSQVAEAIEFGSGSGGDRLLSVSLQRPGQAEEPVEPAPEGGGTIQLGS